jgi:hypothetical protein
VTDNSETFSETSTETAWGKINSTYSGATDINIVQQRQQSELNKIYIAYKRTKDRINSGRKRSRCKKCGDMYFTDEGIVGGFCKLDCKYSNCIMEEENNAKET